MKCICSPFLLFLEYYAAGETFNDYDDAETFVAGFLLTISLFCQQEVIGNRFAEQ